MLLTAANAMSPWVDLAISNVSDVCALRDNDIVISCDTDVCLVDSERGHAGLAMLSPYHVLEEYRDLQHCVLVARACAALGLWTVRLPLTRLCIALHQSVDALGALSATDLQISVRMVECIWDLIVAVMDCTWWLTLPCYICVFEWMYWQGEHHPCTHDGCPPVVWFVCNPLEGQHRLRCVIYLNYLC